MKRLNRILGWALALTLTLTLTLQISLIPSAYADGGGVTVTLRFFEKVANDIYYNDGAPAFILEVRNSSSVPQMMTLTCAAADEEENQVWQDGPNGVTLEANTTLIRSFTPELGNRKGRFQVTASVRSSFGQAQGVQSFSITKRSDSLAEDLGLSCHFGKNTREKTDKSMDLITNAGFGWVRDEMCWETVENERGRYELLQYHEDMANELIGNGQNIMLILGYENPLYENASFPVTQEGIQAYAGYCAFMAEHFKGRINAFEIWNEPDMKVDAGGNDITGAQYTALLKAAYEAVKGVNPEATVIGGVLTGMSRKTARTFLEQMLDAGAAQYMDALSFHPYTSSGYYCDENPTVTFRENIGQAKLLLRNHGAGDMPIWLTEYGSSTFTGSTGYTEWEQAVDLVRAGVQVKADAQVERMFYYNFKESGTDPAEIEHNFGIMRYNYEVKDAYIALAYANSLLSGAKFVSAAADPDCNVRSYSAYRFRDKSEDKDIFVLWGNKRMNRTANLKTKQDLAAGAETLLTDNGEAAPVVTVSAAENREIHCYDMYGNEVTDDRGEYPITEEPLYVVCKSVVPEPEPEPKAEIIAEDGRVRVLGENAASGAEVTLLVRQQNAVGNPIYYIRQTTVDEAGRYSFTFGAEAGDICEVYVYDGGKYINQNVGNEKYNITMAYYVNGTPLTDINQVKSGDTVKAVTQVKLREGAKGEGLLLYGAVSSGRQVPVAADTSRLRWEADMAAAETEIVVNDAADLETLRFMLWNEAMKPVMKAAEVKK